MRNLACFHRFFRSGSWELATTGDGQLRTAKGHGCGRSGATSARKVLETLGRAWSLLHSELQPKHCTTFAACAFASVQTLAQNWTQKVDARKAFTTKFPKSAMPVEVPAIPVTELSKVIIYIVIKGVKLDQCPRLHGWRVLQGQ